jgi:hypothetical protein
VPARSKESRRVAFDEVDVGGRALPGELEQLGDAIDPHDVAHERRQSQRERARAAADVDHALAPVGEDECRDALRQLRSAHVLMRGDLLRSAGEAVFSHRRRRAARAQDRSRCRRRART